MFTIGNDVNSIVFDPENYLDPCNMWNDISEQLKILMRGDYIVVMHKEEDLVIIEYESDESMHSYGLPNPIWITPEQMDALVTYMRTPKEFGNGHESFF